MRILRYKADIKTLIVVAFYFGFTALCWVYFAETSTAAQTFAIIALCILSFICAVIVHNTVHVPIFYSKSLNKAFQIILSMTYGHPVSAFVVGHNLSHHKYTGQAKDIARTSNLKFKWNFLNQLTFFLMTSSSIMKSEAIWVKKMWQEGRKKWVFQYAIELIVVFTFKGLFLIINWKLALLLIWLPHLYAQWGIIGTNYWQHDGCDTNHEYNHSRNFTNNWLNFMMFNNGYHGPHHNHPTIHWSKLPDFYQNHFKPNLDRNSLTKFLFESCVWTGKRLDYLGNQVKRDKKPLNPDISWVNQEITSQNKEHLGVES
jgi:beta-carotene hydroxylase